ncbi:NUDIX hydrolase [Sphaerobacter thermophilus DSM 20745]|uniref:NUDIX hydrolase n=2 Tax=Sphaerobacter TaxID=2056 RepID=D1C7F8_SPHTD|nr:NUDIX hydrolase [Sphaerobacter thermophilus DSM 20745]
MSMISVDIGPAHFLYRVGGVCLHDGRVLLHRAVGDDFWSLPGGRCEILETATDALTREMREELAVEVTVGRLLWVVEDFFTMDGRPYHQIGLYFAVDLPDGCPLLDTEAVHAGQEGDDYLEFRWFPLSDLDQVRLYPTCVRTALQQPLDMPRHLVGRREPAPSPLR